MITTDEAGAGRCANCSSPLTGPYCSQCGQRAEIHVHSLRAFVGEAAEDLTHADSRLWRTLVPLIARPGFLTAEFLAGRRARYLPPLRLYLVISLFFFLVLASVSGPTATGSRGGPACSKLAYHGPGERWMQSRLTASCERIGEDGGRELARELPHNLPRAMFVFLPLIAAIMKLLYWRPRRYYVEHLLFLVHNHSFAFLFLGFGALVAQLLPTAQTHGWLVLLEAVYVGWYFYAATRRVYGNGRARTFAKLAVLTIVYLVGGLMMILATILVSAITL